MKTVHFIAAWQKVVERYPNYMALEEEENAFSYEAVYQKVLRLAAVLTERQFPDNSPILIDIDKSSDFIIAILAVWWSGHYFIPVSSDLPVERKQFIITETKPVAILSKEKAEGALVPVILVTEKAESTYLPVCNSAGIAYIYFTSGSTGTPKGVVLSHKGLYNVLEQQIAFFDLDCNARSLFFLSTLFDASLSDIGTALLSGACLVIPKAIDLNSPQQICQYLIEKKITYVDIPPVVLGVLEFTADFPDLKTIVVGGEAIAAKTVQQWQKKVKLIVVYGPTEATICTSMICCRNTAWEHNFIGAPIAGIEYYLDANDELYIAGEVLAEGYLNQTALTAAKFIYKEGKRYYKTGDRVVQDVYGNYIFKGRIDRQFKINGKLVASE